MVCGSSACVDYSANAAGIEEVDLRNGPGDRAGCNKTQQRDRYGPSTRWGRPKPHALTVQIPGDQFRISGLTLIVNPHGDLATSPRHKLSAYQGQQWQDIEFDPDEIKQAWPKPPPPLISDWMRENATRRRKRDDLVRDCMTATNCSRRQALAAYSELPEEQRRKRGKPSKTSG